MIFVFKGKQITIQEKNSYLWNGSRSYIFHSSGGLFNCGEKDRRYSVIFMGFGCENIVITGS